MRHQGWCYVLLAGLGCLPGVGHGQAAPAPGPAVGTAHRLCWQESRRLVWADFQARTFPKSAPFVAREMGAVSATYATYSPITTPEGLDSYRVDCVFLRDSSWVNAQAIRTAAARVGTLAHEQIHFDIAELVARRLRHRIAQGQQAHEDLYAAPATQDITRIYLAQNTLSDQFDREVAQAGGHRTQAPVVRRWQQHLARQLSLLTAYKSTAATCP